MKILVADDEPVSRRLMERTLQQAGYEVITADNGRSAAQILAGKDAPRLAILDWMMPELDGLGVCREVRNKHHDSYVYILLLTFRESNEDVVKGLEAGADDYLTKPCHPGELRARLHTGRRILQLEDKLVEAREEMRFKATHDALTSLWDRGAILTHLRDKLSRSIMDCGPVSLLLCDVDHFKSINDTYGHQTGDQVLEELATRLLDAVRSNDVVGRYGGEEFLIVLSGVNAEHLKARAEDVCSAISVSPFSTSHGTVPLSISVGAITIENWDSKTPIEHFLKQADVALYRAKAAGRNRVLYANAPIAV